MDIKRTYPQHIWIGLLLLWAFLMLACNMPIIAPDEPLQPPTRSSATAEAPDDDEASSENNLPPTATLSNGGSAENDPDTTDSLPTFTPVLIVTTTPLVTPSGVVTTAPADEEEEGADSAENLELTYEINWRFDEQDKNFSWATVKLTATGGDGEYTFYRDEKPTSGAEFDYRWGSCRANPGSFRVESGDGQSAKLDYFENPPCP